MALRDGNTIKLIHHRDRYLHEIKKAWGVGSQRRDQARRLLDGDIDLDTDREAIQAMAIIVNAQLAIDKAELRELEEGPRD